VWATGALPGRRMRRVRVAYVTTVLGLFGLTPGSDSCIEAVMGSRSARASIEVRCTGWEPAKAVSCSPT
jgi:hypothetical protein